MVRRSGVGIGAILVVLLLGAAPAWGQASAARSVTLSRVAYAGLQMNIATIGAGVRYEIEPRQANNSVTSLLPVARECLACLAAVNGDFFNVGTHQPIGGVIVKGIVLRSPNLQQNQLTVAPNGQIVAGVLQWHAQLAAPDGTTIPLAVNDPNAASAIVYNRNFGAPTPASDAVELSFAQRSAAGLRLDRTLHFRLVGTHRPGQPVPAGQVVVSATGADGALLAQLRQKVRTGQIPPTITMSMSTGPNAWNSLGANHILLRAGHFVPINENDDFAFGPHPRTLFGWNNHGKVILVTIGSSVPGRSAGVSLAAAAQILKGLGVANAVNLDGGGSSTFVSQGRILNHPADGVPRSVANAWVVVRA
jgi:large repetitive protein